MISKDLFEALDDLLFKATDQEYNNIKMVLDIVKVYEKSLDDLEYFKEPANDETRQELQKRSELKTLLKELYP